MQMTDVFSLPSGVQNARNSEGSFIQLDSGKLMYIYTRYCGESSNDNATSDLAACYSDDDGKSWTRKDTIIVDHGDAINVMSVSLLRLQDGRMMLLYLHKKKSAQFGIECIPKVIYSSDEGNTWSAPQNVISLPGYYIINNDRLIQLESGRIVIPVAWAFMSGMDHKDRHSIALIFYSDDGGKTFQKAKDCMLPPWHLESGLQEPGVIEISPGKLWCWSRTSGGFQMISYSEDSGEHWTAPAKSSFLSPCSPMSLKRNPHTGELFAVWNDISERFKKDLPPAQATSWNRTPLVLARSCDNGKTWKDHVLIEKDPACGYCYIGMHFTTDNALLLSYCCGGEKGIVLSESKIKRVQLS